MMNMNFKMYYMYIIKETTPGPGHYNYNCNVSANSTMSTNT